MNPPPVISSLLQRLPWLKRLVLWGIGGLAVLLVLLWLALPPIVQSQAERFVAEKTGHRLKMAAPSFNPLTLSLRLSQLELADPDGHPLLAFDALLVDLSLTSLPLRAWVFDAIRLDRPAVTLTELPQGGLNWGPFLAAFQSKEPQPKPAGLPRFDIRSLIVAEGRLELADQRHSPGFATQVAPLDLDLADVSTLPDDSGSFRVSARTSFGAQISLAGKLDLDPLLLAGSVELQGLSLEPLAPYLKDVLPAAPAGIAELSAQYRIGNGGSQLNVTVDRIEAKVADLRVPLDSSGVAVAVGSVALHGGSVDLAARKASLEKISLGHLSLDAVRGKNGEIDLLRAVAALGKSRPAASSTAPEPIAPPWDVRIGQFAVADSALSFRDEGVAPAAEFRAEGLSLQVDDISTDLKAPLPVQLAFDVASGGRFEGSGTIVPAGPAADLKLKLTELSLKPAQPYVAGKAALDIAGGKLSSEGRVTLDDKGPAYRGDFALRELRLNEAGTADSLLAWKTLATNEMKVTPQRLDIGELRLGGLNTQLIIGKDKSVNLQKVLKSPPPAEAAAAEAAPLPAPSPAPPSAVPPAPAFVVNIDRLRFYTGSLYFADHSLMLHFGTRIHGLRGSINHLSSQRGGTRGQLELEGEVDDYGMARAIGEVDLFDPTGFMDLRVLFRNVEMTRLTPYVATFAGRKIDSGKLSLDLRYQIKQRQLQGDNRVIIDRLTLGERVESATAKELPLDLAIAILEDSDGRIDLGLPVSGSLDDPEFSYGAIVWMAIKNVLTKIVTAPFRALASLFGGGSDTIESIAFEAGVDKLTPPEREKLVRLAEGMAKRPGLVLSVAGTYAETDRLALQDVQLRRALLVRMGQRVSENWDPGPLSTALPAVREALEGLFGSRFGGGDLAALKEGFRKANPGQLPEENLAGKMMSRLSGLLREKKTLSEEEVGRLAGADFYTVLYERLRASEKVGDERLQALGKARGDAALATLKDTGLAGERIHPLPPEAGEGSDGNVALKLVFEPVRKD